MVKKDGQVVPVAFLAMESINGGELFDYVAHTGAFSEPVCRYFFKQMLMGLHHVHSNGYSHRDLKPENILLDVTYLSDDTIIQNQPWSALKEIAMQSDFEISQQFATYDEEEQKTISRLIAAQKAQGDMLVLKKLEDKYTIKIVDFGFAAELQGEDGTGW